MEPKEKSLLLESAFSGGNTRLVQVRIPESLYEAMLFEAKNKKQDLPEFLREAFALYTIPATLKKKINEGTELSSNDRSLLKAYRETLSGMASFCSTIDEAQQKLELHRAVKNPNVQKLIKTMAEEIVTKLFREGQKPKKKYAKRS